MSLSAISAARVVPVSEDLTTEDTALSILRGLENMHRVDKTVGDGVSLTKGMWAVLGDDDQLGLPSATAKANTYLVFAGTDRFDSHATGKATVIMASGLIVRTSMYNDGETYSVGAKLTVKSADGKVTLQTGSEPVLAYVTKVPAGGVIEYEVVR